MYAVNKPEACQMRWGTTDGKAKDEVKDFKGGEKECVAHCSHQRNILVGMYNAVNYKKGQCWCVAVATTMKPDVHSYMRACLLNDPIDYATFVEYRNGLLDEYLKA